MWMMPTHHAGRKTRCRRARIGTGLWLMYLVFAVALNFVLGYSLPL
jgi:hypothetical protein